MGLCCVAAAEPTKINNPCGCSSVGRASVSQTEGRGFETRRPLNSDRKVAVAATVVGSIATVEAELSPRWVLVVANRRNPSQGHSMSLGREHAEVASQAANAGSIPSRAARRCDLDPHRGASSRKCRQSCLDRIHCAASRGRKTLSARRFRRHQPRERIGSQWRERRPSRGYVGTESLTPLGEVLAV